jgi:hypothetical protein
VCWEYGVYPGTPKLKYDHRYMPTYSQVQAAGFILSFLAYFAVDVHILENTFSAEKLYLMSSIKDGMKKAKDILIR